MDRKYTPQSGTGISGDITPANPGSQMCRNGLGAEFSLLPMLARVAAGLLLATGPAWPDGQVILQNYMAGSLDAPVYDADGHTPLEGPAFLAALYAGPTATTLAAVGPAVPFRLEPMAGYFDLTDDPSNGLRVIPTVTPGSQAHVQVRAWEADRGTSYEEALAADGRTGASEVFPVITGGGGTPPAPPSFLSGLNSFALVSPVLDGGGAVLLNNGVWEAGLDAPVLDANGVTLLAGDSYSAMLYAGPNPLSLAPVGSAVPFQVDAGAGYFDLSADPEGGVRLVPTVAPGDLAYLQVRVWETARGATYEEAAAANSKRGISNLFPAWTSEATSPALMLGLEQFHLVIRGGGSVYFMNLSPSQGVNAPVYDTDGVTLLEGPAYVALLDAGPDTASMQPVGDPVPFRTGDGAGYFDLANAPGGGVRVIPSVAPGTTAYLRVRVWETARGSSYEEALAAGGKTGVSTVFSLVTGGSGDPPSVPPPLRGLESFLLVADIPYISPIPDQVINAYESTHPLPFLISDLGTAPSQLELTTATSNPELVPHANIVLGGSGNERTVTITPTPGAFGVAEIEIHVRDEDHNVGVTRFTLRVLRVSWALSLTAAPVEGGSAAGAGSYYDGTQAAIQAVPNAGYRFAGWTGVGIADPTAASTTVSMTQARSVTATFAKTWQLTLAADPQAGGTVTGTAIHDDGSEAMITAVPTSGYAFIRWEGEGIADPTTPTTTALMTENRTVTALFISTDISFVRNPDGTSFTLLWPAGHGFLLEEAHQLSDNPDRFVAVETADGEHTVVIDSRAMRLFRLRLPTP